MGIGCGEGIEPDDVWIVLLLPPGVPDAFVLPPGDSVFPLGVVPLVPSPGDDDLEIKASCSSRNLSM